MPQVKPLNDGKLFRPPIDLALLGMDTLFKESPSNAVESSIREGLAVKMTEVSDEHDANARFLMLVTDEGIVIDVRDEQPTNVLLPMLLTDGGMVIEARAEQL